MKVENWFAVFCSISHFQKISEINLLTYEILALFCTIVLCRSRVDSMVVPKETQPTNQSNEVTRSLRILVEHKETE
jgi:hypothetical protein